MTERSLSKIQKLTSVIFWVGCSHHTVSSPYSSEKQGKLAQIPNHVNYYVSFTQSKFKECTANFSCLLVKLAEVSFLIIETVNLRGKLIPVKLNSSKVNQYLKKCV